MNNHRFQDEFGATLTMPQAILDLLDSGELIDTSWHNDMNPSFQHRDAITYDERTKHEADVRLWVQDEKPADREDPETPRYIVYLGADNEDMIQTDDLDAAIARLRSTAAKVAALRAGMPDAPPTPPHVPDVEAGARYGFAMGQQFIQISERAWHRGEERGIEVRTQRIRVTELHGNAFNYVVDETLSIENPLYLNAEQQGTDTGGGTTYTYALEQMRKGKMRHFLGDSRLGHFTVDVAGRPDVSNDADVNWRNDAIQFARLIAEIRALDWTDPNGDDLMLRLCASMDLTEDRIEELFERADAVWEDVKQRTAPGRHMGTIIHGVDIASYIERGKVEILKDIADGKVPATVTSFSALHDTVDANEYAGLCDSSDKVIWAGDMDRTVDIANAVQNVLDAWLKKGRP